MEQDKTQGTVTMTIGELDAIKESVRVGAKVDSLADFIAGHDKEDKERFDSLFNEIRNLDDDVKSFPKTLAECQQELRNETEQKYVSKKEVRAGFLVVSTIQILVGIVLVAVMSAPAGITQ